jgi:hypothetical protein
MPLTIANIPNSKSIRCASVLRLSLIADVRANHGKRRSTHDQE